jgi:hypothetical protein
MYQPSRLQLLRLGMEANEGKCNGKMLEQNMPKVLV